MGDDQYTIIAGYLAHTDGALLVKAADGFDTAYKSFWTTRGRLSGTSSDLVNSWNSASGKSMVGYLGTVDTALAETGSQIDLVGDSLRSFGKLATSTLTQARQFAVQAYEDPENTDSGGLEVILEPFLEAYKKLTHDLWTYGAIAPGGIPLPQAPPRPPSKWTDWLFGSDYPPFWYWGGAEGSMFQPGEGPGTYDPNHPIWGYDEFGNRVPAYQAAMPIPGQIEENGYGGLLKWLFSAGKALKITSSGARAIEEDSGALAKLIQDSYGWRDTHIDRHIREWYRLGDNEPIPRWMRDEYLKMIVDGGVKQGKVFSWSLRGESGAQPTYSVLRYQNGRWLVSQYYASGSRAGEFATAFEPTARQLAAMLQQSAITP